MQRNGAIVADTSCPATARSIIWNNALLSDLLSLVRHSTLLVQSLQQKGSSSSTIVGWKVAPFKKEVDEIGPQHLLRNDEARHYGLLSLFIPSNSTRSKCQLQVLHGNEAMFVVLSYPNPSVGYETPSCVSTAC